MTEKRDEERIRPLGKRRTGAVFRRRVLEISGVGVRRVIR